MQRSHILAESSRGSEGSAALGGEGVYKINCLTAAFSCDSWRELLFGSHINVKFIGIIYHHHFHAMPLKVTGRIVAVMVGFMRLAFNESHHRQCGYAFLRLFTLFVCLFVWFFFFGSAALDCTLCALLMGCCCCWWCFYLWQHWLSQHFHTCGSHFVWPGLQ